MSQCGRSHVLNKRAGAFSLLEPCITGALVRDAVLPHIIWLHLVEVGTLRLEIQPFLHQTAYVWRLNIIRLERSLFEPLRAIYRLCPKSVYPLYFDGFFEDYLSSLSISIRWDRTRRIVTWAVMIVWFQSQTRNSARVDGHLLCTLYRCFKTITERDFFQRSPEDSSTVVYIQINARIKDPRVHRPRVSDLTTGILTGNITLCL